MKTQATTSKPVPSQAGRRRSEKTGPARSFRSWLERPAITARKPLAVVAPGRRAQVPGKLSQSADDGKPVAAEPWLPLLSQVPVTEVEPGIMAGAAIRVDNPEQWTEQLASQLARLTDTMAMPAGPMLVAFHGGQLEGVRCEIEVTQRQVRCRLRAQGAATRRLLESGRQRLAHRLAISGLKLGQMEVSA